MAQLENIEAIERRLWSAADTLRSNSNYASNEYFMPLMGLIFLRHAYSRYLRVKAEIEPTLPSRGGKTRPLKKEDFSQKSAIFLKDEAQFDNLVALADSEDRAVAIVTAMESIEADYDSLKGVLPKGEYQELDNDVLGQLLRLLNPDELKKATGDIFGRIYEYFLTQFANEKAHDGGEFFTPISIVSFIANVLEPDHGTVLDPACGSGGMFVQSAHFIERQDKAANELTFRGLEKNATTIRLAKMNLAVHGLEGDIQKAITYYEDPHDLLGKADFVMANPPFNVDEVDADKVKNDPRLPFSLPGVNKKGKVSNGNYLWISYFYSYLNESGRAGFVMSSQASSAGRDEAKVRQKLVETGDVDVMVAIRGNFFYTRSVPCELWFLDRGKPAEHEDKVLMLDARNVYRKVTRKIYDFSPEQLSNLLAVVWLYRGEQQRFVDLVLDYIKRTLDEGRACFEGEGGGPVVSAVAALGALQEQLLPFLKSAPKEGPHVETAAELAAALNTLRSDADAYRHDVDSSSTTWIKAKAPKPTALVGAVESIAPLAETSRDLVRQVDLVFKLAARAVDFCETELGAKDAASWSRRDVSRLRKFADEARQAAVEQLKRVRYFYRQGHWLTARFPEAALRDVEGLVKLVGHEELKSNDYSLTPGRYVGVAPEEEDDDFDFEESLREIHVELGDLNAEAASLAEEIQDALRGLGA